MQERSGIITFKGNPMTLLGPELKIGETAPDFRAVDTALSPRGIHDSYSRESHSDSNEDTPKS